MARPREFDTAEALGRAMQCFRHRGYAATSMERLTTDMKIGRQSLYAAYGGKRALFLTALGSYADDMVGRFARLADAPRPLDAIRRILHEVARFAIHPDGEDGCLMTNSAAELAARDPEVRRVLARSYRRIEDLFASALTRAQRDGALPEDRDPRALARFLLTLIQGLRVMGKARPDRRLLRDVVDAATRCLV